MMPERNVYADSSEAIKRLTRNGIGFDFEQKLIQIPVNKRVGIKLWGAVDYLQRFWKFTWCRVR